jgi:MraZ protein
VLRGSQQAKIDEKGRLKLPTNFRSYIDEKLKTAAVYLTCDDSAGAYVRVYPLPVWESVEEKLLKMPSTDIARLRFHRWTSLYGQEGEIDALMQGDVVVVANGDFLEVWNRERFMSQQDSEKLTVVDRNRLSEFGI